MGGFKTRLKENPDLLGRIFGICSSVPGSNRIRGRKGNKIQYKNALLKKCRMELKGSDNEIIIDRLATLNHCLIHIQGNHNRIFIGSSVFLNYTELWIENEGNVLEIRQKTSMDGKKEYPVHLAVIEGTKMIIGEDCMFSSGVELRTGDSHSIVDSDGKRVNASRDIVLGEHIWAGTRSLILKGTRIGSDCVIGAGSIVTGSFEEEGCAIAGNPAGVVRRQISWKRERI